MTGKAPPSPARSPVEELCRRRRRHAPHWRRRRLSGGGRRIASTSAATTAIVGIFVVAEVVFFLKVVSDRAGLPRVKIVLPVDHLSLSQTQIGPLLLILCVRLLPLLGQPSHLLGLPKPPLPSRLNFGRLERGCGDRCRRRRLRLVPVRRLLLLLLLRGDDLICAGQDGLRLGEHAVVSLVEHARVEEPAAVPPGALALAVESAHRLRLQALLSRVAALLVGQLALLQLLLIFILVDIGNFLLAQGGVRRIADLLDTRVVVLFCLLVASLLLLRLRLRGDLLFFFRFVVQLIDVESVSFGGAAVSVRVRVQNDGGRGLLVLPSVAIGGLLRPLGDVFRRRFWRRHPV